MPAADKIAVHVEGAPFALRCERDVPVVEVNQFLLAHEEECSAVLDELRQCFGGHRRPARVFLGVEDGLQQIVDQFLFLVREH